MKRKIELLFIGVLSLLTISFVGAVYLYNANDIEYNPGDDSWNVNNVDEAIKDLKNNYISKNEFLGNVWVYGFSGNEQVFEVHIPGTYKLEVWGAQGGSSGGVGGYGAYSVGEIKLNKGEKLYINVGGQGNVYGSRPDEATWQTAAGGYNGGGQGYSACGNGGGGGASSIAKVSGILNKLSGSKESIIIVASGGGGSFYWKTSSGSGQHGGGYQVTSNNSSVNEQGTFGQGGAGKGNRCGGGGGGGGYQGGVGGGDISFGGGGSSYIGYTQLENKGMYCYSCAQSTDVDNKTTVNSCVNSNPTEKCSKQGNGYAKITLINID